LSDFYNFCTIGNGAKFVAPFSER